MKFREVLLVVVLILAGFVFYQFKTGNWNIDGDWDWDGFGTFSREYTSEETRTIEAPLPPALEIENGHGWVEVRGTDQGTIELTFKKVAWRRTEEEAKEVADRLKYTLTTAPDKLTLATNRDEFSRRSFETGFVLTVPRTMIVRVVNAYGSVRIDGVAETTVINRNGEVFASDVGGACRVETSYDDIDVQRVGGECRIANRNGDVRAGSVEGDLWVKLILNCAGNAVTALARSSYGRAAQHELAQPHEMPEPPFLPDYHTQHDAWFHAFNKVVLA